MTARSEAAFDRIVSYHEAGHAVAHIRLNIRFRRVWLCHPKTGRGYVSGCRIPSFKSAYRRSQACGDVALGRWLEDDAVVNFAGPLAERRYAPRSDWREGMGHIGVEELYYGDTDIVSYIKTSRDSDLHNVNADLDLLGCSHNEDRDTYRSLLIWHAAALVKKLWPEITAVAGMLLRKNVSSQAEVRRLMNRAWR
jgi:hypothetical protein